MFKECMMYIIILIYIHLFGHDKLQHGVLRVRFCLPNPLLNLQWLDISFNQLARGSAFEVRAEQRPVGIEATVEPDILRSAAVSKAAAPL